MMVISNSDELVLKDSRELEHLHSEQAPLRIATSLKIQTLDQIEKQHIEHVLAQVKGNQTLAARTTLVSRMKKLGIGKR